MTVSLTNQKAETVTWACLQLLNDNPNHHFASRLNKKCSTFVSWKPDPEASHINAFTLRWNFKLADAFPPFFIISRVWRKALGEKSQLILVVPNWPGQPWYARLIESAREKMWFQRKRGNLVNPSLALKDDPLGCIKRRKWLIETFLRKL